jgi:hypothetical protein
VGAAELSVGSHYLLEHPTRRLEYLGGAAGLEGEDSHGEEQGFGRRRR